MITNVCANLVGELQDVNQSNPTWVKKKYEKNYIRKHNLIAVLEI